MYITFLVLLMTAFMQVTNFSFDEFARSFIVKQDLCQIVSNAPISKFYNGTMRTKPRYLKDADTPHNKPMNPNEIQFINCPRRQSESTCPRPFGRWIRRKQTGLESDTYLCTI